MDAASTDRRAPIWLIVAIILALPSLHGGIESDTQRCERAVLARWYSNALGLCANNPGLESSGVMLGSRAARLDSKVFCQRLRGGRSTALGQRLQNLQYVMKKDPEGYIPEVQGHLENWEASLRAWERAPDLVHQEFGELSVFLCGSMNHFPSLLAGFGGQVLILLERNSTHMHNDLRMAMTRAIAMAIAMGITTVGHSSSYGHNGYD